MELRVFDGGSGVPLPPQAARSAAIHRVSNSPKVEIAFLKIRFTCHPSTWIFSNPGKFLVTIISRPRQTQAANDDMNRMSFLFALL